MCHDIRWSRLNTLYCAIHGCLCETGTAVTSDGPPSHMHVLVVNDCRTFLALPEVQSRQAQQRRKLEAAASWERRKIYGKVCVKGVDVVSLVGGDGVPSYVGRCGYITSRLRCSVMWFYVIHAFSTHVHRLVVWTVHHQSSLCA